MKAWMVGGRWGVPALQAPAWPEDPEPAPVGQRSVWWRGVRLVLVLALLPLVIGCETVGGLAPPEPTTISFVYMGSETYFRGLIEEFQEEHDHITVELVSFRSAYSHLDDYDVYFTAHYQLSNFLENDQIAELNSFIQRDDDFDLNDFYPNLVRALSVEGQRYGIPIGADALGMYYNTTLFDATGTPYPEVGWTWQDFLARATQISSPDQGIFGYAYHHMGNLGMFEPMVWVYQHGGRWFDDLDAPTRMVVNDPLTVEALEWYADLIYEHEVAPPPGNRSMPYPDRGIENDRYAMWMDWFGSEREEHWAVAPLPRDQNGTSFGVVLGLFISSDTLSPDACWTWVEFLSEQTAGGLIPARRSLAESAEFEQAVGEDVAAAARASVEELRFLNLRFDGQLGQAWGQSASALSVALTQIRSGEPVPAMLDEAQQKME